MKSILVLLLILTWPGLLPAHALPLFQAGEAGVTLEWQPNAPASAEALRAGRPAASNPVSLAGATVILRAVKYPGGTPASLACTVSSDGSNATYTMISTDFPVAGAYQLQFVATWSNGTIRKSPVKQIEVGPAL